MGKKRILCFGEISWDRLWLLDQLPTREGDSRLLMSERGGPGGCALNTACVLRGFGLPITLAGNAVGWDPEGDKITKYLRRIRMDARIVKRKRYSTPFCQVMVESKTGRRTFVLSHRDIQHFASDQVAGLVEEIRGGAYSHLFVQPYTRIGSMKLLRAIQSVSGLWILIQDVGPQSPFVALADAAQISLPEDEPFTSAAVRGISAPYFHGRMNTVFVTAGGRGVGVCTRQGKPVLFQGIRAKRVVDTTGCGDAFRAGLMWGLYQGLSLPDSVRLGQRAGAHKAGIYGSHFVGKMNGG
jgi:sugar/nucleoside kinase (ribokinase family)